MKAYLYRVDKTNEFRMHEGEVKIHGVEGIFKLDGERWGRYSVSGEPGVVKGGSVWFIEPNEKGAVKVLTAYFKVKRASYMKLVKNLDEKMKVIGSIEGGSDD